MQIAKITAERLPMVCFLAGLLFNAAALLVGFDYGAAFAGLFLGWILCAFGVALFVLQRREGPSASAATRLSADFISAGATVQMPSPKVES